MTRHCNGTDPNLTMYVDVTGNRTEELAAGDKRPTKEFPKPCDCGRTFDDVKYSTIYPHERI